MQVPVISEHPTFHCTRYKLKSFCSRPQVLLLHTAVPRKVQLVRGRGADPRGCSLADTPAGYMCSLQIQGGLSLPSPGAGHDGNLSKKKMLEWHLA